MVASIFPKLEGWTGGQIGQEDIQKSFLEICYNEVIDSFIYLFGELNG